MKPVTTFSYVTYLSTCSHSRYRLLSLHRYTTLEPQSSFFTLPFGYLASYMFNTAPGLFSIGMRIFQRRGLYLVASLGLQAPEFKGPNQLRCTLTWSGVFPACL